MCILSVSRQSCSGDHLIDHHLYVYEPQKVHLKIFKAIVFIAIVLLYPVYRISEVCALYPPVKEKVHCSAPKSEKKLVMHRIRWQIQHWFFHSAEKSIFFNDYFITEFGDDLLATNSSRNPVMKTSLFSFVIFWATEFSAYICTEVDENDFGQDFSTEFSEKLCASLNSMTN